MERCYAVLDTCVLLPGPLYNTLLFIAGHRVYQPIWTDLILAELARNLRDPADPRRRKSAAQVERRLGAMAAAFEPAANLDRQGLDYRALIDTMPNHPKDRHVLAAALAVEAEYLVTANVRDFRIAERYAPHLAIATPDEFLLDLLDRSSWHRANILSALHKQRQYGTRFPTLESLVDALARSNQTHRFADRIRDLHAAIADRSPDLARAILAGERIAAQLLVDDGR